jgi:hypothetical protein
MIVLEKPRGIMIDGRRREIIGIMPAAFLFLDGKPDFLLPQRWNRAKTVLGNYSYAGDRAAEARSHVGTSERRYRAPDSHCQRPLSSCARLSARDSLRMRIFSFPRPG